MPQAEGRACCSEIGVRFNVDMAGVPCVGDGLRDLQAAEAVGAQPMLVLTGKGEKTLRDGGFPKNTVIFPDLAFVASALLVAATRRGDGLGAALAGVRAVPDDRDAALRAARCSPLALAAAAAALSVHHRLVRAEPVGRALDLRHPASA